MDARKDMRKSPLPKPGSILGALLGARGGASKSPNRKNRKSANMEEKWVLMVKLTIFAKLNEISPFFASNVISVVPGLKGL